MHILRARNVHAAIPEAAEYIRQGLNDGRVSIQESRAGQVYRSNEPVVTQYDKPCERVEFHPERDSNPFFHFFESLWMLAGRNDVEYVTRFAKNMANFSDDGVTFHGAYGHRWRHHFGTDQILNVCAQLRENHLDRRVVLQMWDPHVDGNCRDGKDFPCNLTILFTVNPGTKALDMTVFNRSNDIVWGAYGANAVHMSMLQEYIASSTGWPVGTYYQISNNWHSYASTFDKIAKTLGSDSRNPYDTLTRWPLMSVPQEQWDQDLLMYLEEGPILGFRDSFFKRVVTPLHHAWEHYQNNKGEHRYEGAYEILEQCKAKDWQYATMQWIARRKQAWVLKNS